MRILIIRLIIKYQRHETCRMLWPDELEKNVDTRCVCWLIWVFTWFPCCPASPFCPRSPGAPCRLKLYFYLSLFVYRSYNGEKKCCSQCVFHLNMKKIVDMLSEKGVQSSVTKGTTFHFGLHIGPQGNYVYSLRAETAHIWTVVFFLSLQLKLTSNAPMSRVQLLVV